MSIIEENQDGLFDAVQESLFDVGPSDEVGFPSERVIDDGADNVIGFDELADRRRRKTS